MKKTFLMLLTIAFAISMSAQDSTKQKEIGLAFNNLDNFGITYKFGNSKAVWRLSTMLINGQKSNWIYGNQVQEQNSIGFELAFGREYRKLIAQKLEFRYGGDIHIKYSKGSTESIDKFNSINDFTSETVRSDQGVNVVLGFNYLITDNLLIGAELLPYFGYESIKSTSTSGAVKTKNNLSGFHYNFSKNVLLNLSYRF